MKNKRSKIGLGYGSEWHLLRYLGRHREEMNRKIEETIGCKMIGWLDFPFDKSEDFFDSEWLAMDFLGDSHPVQLKWKNFWPQSGNQQNWDAVGRIKIDGQEEWVLVEAKAHLEEIESHTNAKPEGGLAQIRKNLVDTMVAAGVDPSEQHVNTWLKKYYQYANRLAALHFLWNKNHVSVRILNIYFCGDKHPSANWNCPTSSSEWQTHLNVMYEKLGLQENHSMMQRVHRLFLPVCR